MQNAFHQDLQKSSINKDLYSKCLYVRINNEAKIKQLLKEGYVSIKQSDSSDLILLGIPKPVVKEKDLENVKKK